MAHRDFMPSMGYFLRCCDYVKVWKGSRKARYGF
jgi:hypothetical protein